MITSSIHFNAWFIGAITAIILFAAPATAEDIQSLWNQSPHADSASQSFRHWDDNGTIPSDCATCHVTSGFIDYLGEDGSNASMTDKNHPPGNGIECTACHNNSTKVKSSVKFPSGVEIDNLTSSVQCMVCHQGRSSTVSVNKKIEGLADDVVSPELGFINIHYRAAAATLYGTEVKGGYEYKGKDYIGRFMHVPGVDTCVSCHDAHSLEVKVDTCATCHNGSKPLEDIRMSMVDFDGDGNKSERIAFEIETLHAALNTAIMQYSKEVADSPIVYIAGRYPYFFNDLNANQQPDTEEAMFPNKYQHWTPRLLRAAYNYQFVAVDPGAFSHNPVYVMQLLYDSLGDLGGKIDNDLSSFKRP